MPQVLKLFYTLKKKFIPRSFLEDAFSRSTRNTKNFRIKKSHICEFHVLTVLSFKSDKPTRQPDRQYGQRQANECTQTLCVDQSTASLPTWVMGRLLCTLIRYVYLWATRAWVIPGSITWHPGKRSYLIQGYPGKSSDRVPEYLGYLFLKNGWAMMTLKITWYSRTLLSIPWVSHECYDYFNDVINLARIASVTIVSE